MITSSKTVAIISSVVLATSGGLLYYLNTRDTPDILGWADSSWLYRRSIDVGNDTSGTLVDEHVLVEVDTASLVTAGKLQSDCDDLRFIDSDDSTGLAYWIEGGCNTSSTQVWVKIPSLPSDGKSVYMYYGNESATNAQESWSGNFVVLSTVSCPSGWSRATEFDDRFPYGSNTYGTTGGATTHTHSISETLTGSCTAFGVGTGGNPNFTTSSTSHTHTVSTTTSSGTITPPYRDMVYCKNTNLLTYENMVILSKSSLTGWNSYTDLNDKFPRGASTAGGTGGAATHNHTTSAGTSTASSGTVTGWNEDGSITATRNHTHSFGASTASTESNLPSYYTVQYLQASSSSVSKGGMITMASTNPPLGWTYVSELDTKFPYGSSTSGTTGGTSTHTHTGSMTIGNQSAIVELACCGSPPACRSHNHGGSLSYTTQSASTLPPYHSTLFIQRNLSQTISVGEEQKENTNPDAPTSLLTEGQTNPTGVSDTTPEFSAIYTDENEGDTATHYQIQVNTSSDFTGTTMWDSTKTEFGTPISNGSRTNDISYNGTTLEWGTTYYWRIKVWDYRGDESTWSNTANFRMNYIPNTPSTPYCEGTTNPKSVTDTTPEFSAIFTDNDSTDTATHFQIQVNTSSDFTGTTMWDSTKTSFSTPVNNGNRSPDRSYAGTSLVSGTTYYWRIKFWDSKDLESNWSSTSHFTMQGPPLAPTDLQKTLTNPGRPTFSAIYLDPNEDNANAYEIDINTNIGFDGTTVWNSGKTSTNVSHNSRSPEYGGYSLTNTNNTFYWRIRFWDTNNLQGEWSTPQSIVDFYPVFQISGTKFEGVKMD